MRNYRRASIEHDTILYGCEDKLIMTVRRVRSASFG